MPVTRPVRIPVVNLQDYLREEYALFADFFGLDLSTKRRYGNVEGGQRGYEVTVRSFART